MIKELDIMTDPKSTFCKGFIDLNAVSAVLPYPGGITQVLSYLSIPLYVKMSSVEFAELVTISKTNMYASTVATERKIEFETVHIGEFSYGLDLHWNTNNEDFICSIIMNSNFNVKNDTLKAIIENIHGVEKYDDFSWSKYQTRITIGKMFDPYDVRANIEVKIQEFLTD